jgi:hypothetical protein
MEDCDMETKKVGYLILPMALGFAVVLIMIALMGVSSASAQEIAGIMEKPPAMYEPIYTFVSLTDTVLGDITDLSGNLIGEGVHGGEMMCINNNCSRETQLYFTSPLIETTYYDYKFKDLQARDPEERLAVVTGKGTISNADKKERFTFTATFIDNLDGTVFVRYDASTPEASFIVPRSPGRIEFQH